jgi:phosphoribosyl-ATP pyrophosphohydrolase/phosphoribosyl-AMP cyclohydrolase
MKIDFNKMQGLVPAIVQDEVTGEVLMLGFMNRDALRVTLDSGYATFFSRTRGSLWTKGETSGNKLKVNSILVDCDNDTLLLKVKRLGAGNVCHTGERSCFYRKFQ